MLNNKLFAAAVCAALLLSPAICIGTANAAGYVDVAYDDEDDDMPGIGIAGDLVGSVLGVIGFDDDNED